MNSDDRIDVQLCGVFRAHARDRRCACALGNSASPKVCQTSTLPTPMRLLVHRQNGYGQTTLSLAVLRGASVARQAQPGERGDAHTASRPCLCLSACSHCDYEWLSSGVLLPPHSFVIPLRIDDDLDCNMSPCRRREIPATCAPPLQKALESQRRRDFWCGGFEPSGFGLASRDLYVYIHIHIYIYSTFYLIYCSSFICVYYISSYRGEEEQKRKKELNVTKPIVSISRGRT
jgi:hypothetical protein